jgi:cell division initiation protein
MAITPVEIRHIKFGHGFRGYKPTAVDRLLAEIAVSFEDVWRERADLVDKVEHLETELERFRELEALLRATLVSAERASSETKEQARKEAELVVAEAHAEAREVIRKAAAENERLSLETRRLRERLKLALASLESSSEDHEERPPAFGAAKAASGRS